MRVVGKKIIIPLMFVDVSSFNAPLLSSFNASLLSLRPPHGCGRRGLFKQKQWMRWTRRWWWWWWWRRRRRRRRRDKGLDTALFAVRLRCQHRNVRDCRDCGSRSGRHFVWGVGTWGLFIGILWGGYMHA